MTSLKEKFTTADFNERPFIAIWEITQACDLSCVHCRASAQPLRNAQELSTEEGRNLIDQIHALDVPIFILTGGDPLKRPDLFDLVSYAHSLGMRTALSPSATPLLTREAIVKLKESGLTRMAISLDGSCVEVHEKVRRVSGAFDRTMSAIRWARELGLPVQINTTISRNNIPDFDNMVELLKTLDIVLWSVFFLVPTGRGKMDDLVTGEEAEEIFGKLYEASRRVPFDIKTTEAMHYRRYILQQKARDRAAGVASPVKDAAPDFIGRAPRGLNDAKGFVFISHKGEVYPSGFLPLCAGSVRQQPLADIYRYSPVFRMLRDTEQLEGKCGDCEFNHICGGSRARAYAVTGNPMAQEPCCIYQPKSKKADLKEGRVAVGA